MPLVKKLKQKAWDSWRKSVDRGIRKLPKGAVSFHYRVFEKGNFRWQEIDALREMFGLTDLYLFHGVAMEKPPELLHALKKKTTNATVVASEWIGSVVSADRSRENFEPRIVKLGKL